MERVADWTVHECDDVGVRLTSLAVRPKHGKLRLNSLESVLILYVPYQTIVIRFTNTHSNQNTPENFGC